MKKIYYAGDLISSSGPAMVNKSYYKYLKDKMIFCFSNNRIYRIFHYLLHLMTVNTVIVSGFSKLNLLQIKIAKILNKKVLYLMHGFVMIETKYQNIDNKEERINTEYSFLKYSDIIVCVSEKFANLLKTSYREFDNKIVYINNGIDIEKSKNEIKNDIFTIISVGGGMHLKNNLAVCKAIEKARIEADFIVVGKSAEDGEKIRQYSFVKYYEFIPHEELLRVMSTSHLYIQNSYFEGFGLAILEALNCNCNILISKNVGAISILSNIENDDLIDDVDDIDEISNKIKNKINKNECRITYNADVCSSESRARELLDICN